MLPSKNHRQVYHGRTHSSRLFLGLGIAYVRRSPNIDYYTFHYQRIKM